MGVLHGFVRWSRLRQGHRKGTREDAAGSVDGQEGSFSISRGKHWEKHEKSHHSKPHALWGPQVEVREGLGSVLEINWGPVVEVGEAGLSWPGRGDWKGPSPDQRWGSGGREGLGANSDAVRGAEQPTGPALKPSTEVGSRSPGGCRGLGKHQAGCLWGG